MVSKMYEFEYREIISNITKSNNPIEILNNYDNLKWLIEKERYQQSKRLKKTINQQKGFFKLIGFD